MAQAGFTSLNSMRAIDDEQIDTVCDDHDLEIGQICALKGLVRYLNSDVQTETSSEGPQLDEKYIEIITRQFYIIIENTEKSTLEHILQYLVSKSVLNENENMECSDEGQTYKNRTAKLLKLIIAKSNTDFHHLVNAFKNAGKPVVGQLLTEGELLFTLIVLLLI